MEALMKTAVRVLVIVGCVIGFIWSIVGFFGGMGGGVIGKLAEDDKLADESINIAAYSIISFFVVIASLVFGIVCSREKSKKAATIVNGLLLLLCGIIVTATVVSITARRHCVVFHLFGAVFQNVVIPIL